MNIQRMIAAGALGVLASGAWAQAIPCNEAASERKLSGGAKQSFLKSCEAEARAACAAKMKEENLSAAGKATFEKRCLRQAMGD